MGSTDLSSSSSSADRSRVDRELDPDMEARFRAEMQVIAARRAAQAEQDATETRAKRRFWLAHHWPEHYGERCFDVWGHPVCRRCSALYPVGFALAFAAAAGMPAWPNTWDPAAIWLLCLPATIAFAGEMLGWFRYSTKWQVGTTMVAGLAFGKALSYELDQRWSTEFWGPIAVFGGIWFFASYIGHHRRTRVL